MTKDIIPFFKKKIRFAIIFRSISSYSGSEMGKNLLIKDYFVCFLKQHITKDIIPFFLNQVCNHI